MTDEIDDSDFNQNMSKKKQSEKKFNQTRFSTPMKCNETIYIGFQRT